MFRPSFMVAATIFAALSSPTWASNPLDMQALIARELTKVMHNAIVDYDLPPAKILILDKYSNKIIADTRLARYVEKKFKEGGTTRFPKEYGEAIMMELRNKGALRLSGKDLKPIMDFQYQAARELSATDCRKFLVLGDRRVLETEVGKASIKPVVRGMSDAQFEAIYAFAYKAIDYELGNKGHPTVLTQERLQKIEDEYAKALVKALKTKTPKEQERLVYAIGDLNNAPAEASCEAAIFMLDDVVDAMPAQYQELFFKARYAGKM